MKNKVVILLLVVVMALSFTIPSFAMPATEPAHQTHRYVPIDPELDFDGASGNHYEVYFSRDVVGYNHLTVGEKVKVCQAYSRVTSGRYIVIDGIWGNQSDSALRSAQGIIGVTSDGVCGYNTWNAFNYYYGYVTPNAVKDLL